MNIVVLGNKKSGKSSILKIIFQKISVNEAFFIESTSKIEEYVIKNNPFAQCTIYDFPGNFEISHMNSSERKYLQTANVVVLVLDARDEPYNRTLEKFLSIENEIFDMNHGCAFELLIHKLDGDAFAKEDIKMCVYDEVNEIISLGSTERNIPQPSIYMTSIFDPSIFIAFSKILQKSVPSLMFVSDLFDAFIVNSMVDKVYIIDIISKLFIATDSGPIDLVSYELCCDLIDVNTELSVLYG